jgi:hypothetical protein
VVTQADKPFRAADTRDSPGALFFGFTDCPDICPTTLLDMSNDLVALGERADAIKMIFVTDGKRRQHSSSQQLAQLGKLCMPILVEAQHAGELAIAAKQKHRRRMFDRISLLTPEAPESRAIGVGESHDGID